MSRIRTIRETVRIIREEDPESAVTETTLRRAVKNNEIPYRTSGERVLLDVDAVERYYGYDR